MNVNSFELIAQILKERSGLALSKDKAYLLESRLNPVARKWNCNGFDELVDRVREGGNEVLLADITEAMTTNESFFFRDHKPFELFRDVVLPYMLQHRATTRSFRIWSAACSSGQEPYTIAMQLRELEQQLAGWKIEIIASDLSAGILAKAIEGQYTQFEVQRGLPIKLLMKYFKQNGERWQIDESIRKMVQFKKINLLDDVTVLGKFDVVFCRNVLIYFDPPTKTEVLDKIANMLPADGFLYLGGAETVLGTNNRFQVMPDRRGIYTLAPVDHAASAIAG